MKACNKKMQELLLCPGMNSLFTDVLNKRKMMRKSITKVFYESLLVFSLVLMLAVPLKLFGNPTKQKSSGIIEKKFHNHSQIRVEFLTENILRIQIVPESTGFEGSGLNRYGFIKNYNENVNVKISDSRNKFFAETSSCKVKVDCSSGELKITDISGEKILVDQSAFEFASNYSKVSFHASSNEDWMGFGDQTRKRLYHRGYEADCYVRDVQSYIPVPFFMSTLGAGVLVNTTSHIIFDMCKSNPDSYFWKNYAKTIDFYVMVGDGFGELIDLYTDLTGKPKLPPEWAFGLWYICRTQANDREVMSDALNFRREEIPCNVIGLEPGWMEQIYDYSTEKKWSKERFPIPEYAPNGPHNFINAIKRMGYKFELWLCNDYDLTYEEERKIDEHTQTNISTKSGNESNDRFEVDQHLSHPIYLDKLTKKDEPWFEHLKKFVDQGVDFFKQDAANQVLDHPDRLWGNGMTNLEMHNLYPLLYSRQMYEGLKEYTNKRPVVFTPCGWTGFQAWATTWTGDTGGRLSSLGGLLNSSLVGHSWSTTDMEVAQKEGIHFGYLQPLSEICSWNYFRMPWLQGDEFSAMHRFYSQFRMRLIPYIYSWAYYATQTGYPLLRPLTIEFPEDLKCRDNLHQYLLGRDLMVGVYNKEIYFPEGSWKDYWTGEVVCGLQLKKISWPENRGGALYVRSGAIIPLGSVMQYWGEKPVNEVSLYIFPDYKGSEFNFYEDDGVSFENQNGKYSITTISAKTEKGGSVIRIGESKGNFKGKVEKRNWNIIMHQEKQPKAVFINEKNITPETYSWDESRKELTINTITTPAIIKVEN